MGERRPKEDGYKPGDIVYALRHPATGYIKIGKTQDFKVRYSGLFRLYGPLTPLGSMPGYTETEAFTHLRFWHLRSKPLQGNKWERCRDWFKPSNEIDCFVADYMTPLELPKMTAKRVKALYDYKFFNADVRALRFRFRFAGLAPIQVYDTGDGETCIASFRVSEHGSLKAFDQLRSISDLYSTESYWHDDLFVMHTRIIKSIDPGCRVIFASDGRGSRATRLGHLAAVPNKSYWRKHQQEQEQAA